MKIKGIEIKACIFDLDGTVLDSCGVWHNVDKRFFQKRGMDIPEGYAKAITAFGLEESAVYTKTTYGFKDSIEDIMAEWLGNVQEEYEKRVDIKENSRKFIELLSENNIPMMVATANARECYEPCLERLGLTKYFKKVIDVKNIPGGKTSSRIFDICAEELGYSHEDIMVFEDSVIAINAAKNAGYKTCAIYEKVCFDEEHKKEIADIYIHSFDELMK